MLKKILFSLFLFSLYATTKAQTPNYALLATNGTYTAITGGTVATISSGDIDDGFSNGIPIGFTFNYNGVNYTTVSGSANGWLTFGQNITSISSTNDLSSGGNRPLVAPFYEDLALTANANFTYQTAGVVGSRVFTMQWANMLWDFGASTPSISFQAKLYEGTNVIEFIYRQESGNVALNASGGASIGITGTTAATFLSLSDAGTIPLVSTTVSTNTIVDRPATGQIYRWTPYCSAAATSILATGEKISNVSFVTLVNPSTSAAGYENFSALSTVVEPGKSYPITINTSNGVATDQVLIWIDYNHNGSFDDAGELVHTSVVGSGPYTATIAIPAFSSTVLQGIARMRIRLQDTNTPPANATSCGNSAQGQVEDYSVNIQPCFPAAVTTQPANKTLCIGSNGAISAIVTGTGITYQWQVSANGGATYSNISDGVVYAGTTTSTLSISSASESMNGYRYRLVLAGTCTPANTTSSAATLSVNKAAIITAAPQLTKACVGTSTMLSVAATGNDLSYQWQLSTDGGISYTNISGATTPTLSLPAVTMAQNGNRYRVLVSTASCNAVTSAPAILTVNPLPEATLSAAPAAIHPSQTTYLTSGSVATGVSYVWKRNGVIISGANSNTLAARFDSLGKYQVVITDANGCSNTSNAVVLESSPSDSLFIYPNPSAGKFQVRYYATIMTNTRTVTVYNAIGRIVARKTFELGSNMAAYQPMNFDLSALPSGVYTVIVYEKYYGSHVAGKVLIVR